MPGSLRSAAALVLAACAVLSAGPAAAYGHGDPSAHYLETDALYPAFANPPSQAVELELLGLLHAARDARYPIKVALVGGEDDVADTPQMLARPQRYAEQLASDLGAERPLSAPLIVVSPHGLGVAGRAMYAGRFGPVRRADARALVRGVELRDRPDGDALARVAMAAVRRVARLGGRPLPAHVPPATTLSPGRPGEERATPGWVVPLAVFAGLFLLAWLGYEVRTRAARRGRGDVAGDPVS
jgi:hypothetical protein